ncbi:MAG: BACON domain-containing carbohydrate-binding protein [Bacteroidales bacterium]
MEVTSNTDWTVISDQSWLTVSPASSFGDASIIFTATENTTVSARAAIVTVSASGIADRTITVTQAAAEPTLNVSTTTASVGSAASSTATVEVTSNTDWTVSSDQAWLTVSPASAFGDASIVFTATENTTVSARAAIVTVSASGVADRVITVTQAAAEPTLNVSTTTVGVGSAASSTATVEVTSNTDWTVSSDQSWLTVSPASAIGDGVITFTAAENISSSERSAAVTVSATGIANQVITITQSACVVSYTISVAVNPENYGTITGGGTYSQGASVSLTAIPNDGYAFVNWTENGTEVSTDAVYSFTASADRMLVANFKVATGINEVTEVNAVKVYPNPVETELTIEVEGNNQSLDFEIVNMGGRVVYSGKIVDRVTVPMSNFIPGIYILKLKNAGNIDFKKIIKE